MTDLVRGRVAVIATPAGNFAAQVAKAAQRRSPSCSASAKTRSSLALSQASPDRGGNLTGINFFSSEYNAKRLRHPRRRPIPPSEWPGMRNDTTPSIVSMKFAITYRNRI